MGYERTLTAVDRWYEVKAKLADPDDAGFAPETASSSTLRGDDDGMSPEQLLAALEELSKKKPTKCGGKRWDPERGCWTRFDMGPDGKWWDAKSGRWTRFDVAFTTSKADKDGQDSVKIKIEKE